MSHPALLAAVAILAVSGCATTQLPPISSGHAALEEDEKRIWVRGREEANALDGGAVDSKYGAGVAPMDIGSSPGGSTGTAHAFAAKLPIVPAQTFPQSKWRPDPVGYAPSYLSADSCAGC